MKSIIKSLFLTCFLVAISGCVSVKTEHKVEPIHITMDINLKVQKELEDFFGDIYGDESTTETSE